MEVARAIVDVRRKTKSSMTEIPTGEGEHLLIFRPGEVARRLPRWQFGLYRTGRCGANLTYPIPGFPWRNNAQESFDATLDPFTVARVFEEVETMPANFPEECFGMMTFGLIRARKRMASPGIERRIPFASRS